MRNRLGDLGEALLVDRRDPLEQELRANGVTMLLTTHAMDEAEALADQVYIVDRGRVAISGTVRQLTKSGGSLESVFLSHTSPRAVS